MNKHGIYIVLTFIFTGCASAIRITSLNDTAKHEIKFIITYPDFAGLTKDDAKEKRKTFLNQAIYNIYESIFRFGKFGKSDFDKNDYGFLKNYNLNDGYIPFVAISDNPLVIMYQNEKQNSSLGSISSDRASGGDPLVYPIAKKQDKSYILSPKKLQNMINSNVMIITKNDLNSATKEFYLNHQDVDVKSIFSKFLTRYTSHSATDGNPVDSLHKKLFVHTMNIQYGAGISVQDINEKNSLKYSLKDEGERQFIWGLMFLLNSELKAQRVGKDQVEIIITLPIEKILKRYTVKTLETFIEQ